MKFKFFKVCFPSHSVTTIDRKSERTINIKISLEQKQFLAQNEDIFHNFESKFVQSCYHSCFQNQVAEYFFWHFEATCSCMTFYDGAKFQWLTVFLIPSLIT